MCWFLFRDFLNTIQFLFYFYKLALTISAKINVITEKREKKPCLLAENFLGLLFRVYVKTSNWCSISFHIWD